MTLMLEHDLDIINMYQYVHTKNELLCQGFKDDMQRYNNHGIDV